MSEKPSPLDKFRINETTELTTDRILAVISDAEIEYGNNYDLVIKRLKNNYKNLAPASLDARTLLMVIRFFDTLNHSVKIIGNRVAFDNILGYSVMHPDSEDDVKAVLKNLVRQKIGQR